MNLRQYLKLICFSLQINTDRFNAIWPKLCVLARCRPFDKYTLVKGMMESHVKPAGEIVAVTGSGAHDGPVLRMADVGFTMVSIVFHSVTPHVSQPPGAPNETIQKQ